MNNKLKDLEYPQNLIYAIFGEEAEDIIYNADIIPDFAGSVEYVLHTLYEREANILKDRYLSLMTYDELGKSYNITRERVRQIEARALRKLRHPSRAKYLRCGVSGILENIRADYFEKAAQLESKLIELCKLNEKTANEIIDNAELRKKYAPMRIEEADFSVRSYNCLKRAGIDTMPELARLTYNELTKIRNLGRRSVNEIIDKLREYGYEVNKGSEQIL